MGLGRLELPTPRLSSVCSNQLSYRPISLTSQKANKQATERAVIVFLKKEKRSRRHFAIPSGCIEAAPWRIAFRWSPDWCHLCSKKHGKVHPGLIRRSGQASYQFHSFLRKEVIQPQVPLRLPCYDFTPVADPTVVACLLAVGAAPSGKTNSHGVTGGVYKARERIHRGVLIHDY